MPNFARTARDHMAMPEQGFDKPLVMGHGLNDTDVPYSLTEPLRGRGRAAKCVARSAVQTRRVALVD